MRHPFKAELQEAAMIRGASVFRSSGRKPVTPDLPHGPDGKASPSIKRARLSPPEGAGDKPGPKTVKVTAAGKVVCKRALVAEQDQGLVLLPKDGKSSDSHLGIYSGGFVNCKAIILESDDAVGLAHTSDDHQELDETIVRCLSAFTRDGRTGVKLTIGYAIETLRQYYLAEMAGMGSAAAYVAYALGVVQAEQGEAALGSLGDGASEDDRRQAVAGALVALDRLEIVRWAEHRDHRLMELPHSALLLRRDGAVEAFDEPPVIEAVSAAAASLDPPVAAAWLEQGAAWRHG
jgi:hypothetical protein